MILGGSWIISPKKPRSLLPTVKTLGSVVDLRSCDCDQIALLVSVSWF